MTTPPTTAEKLAEAEATVEALKVQLAAEQAPKVGDRYRAGTSTAEVKYVGHFFIVLRKISDTCQPARVIPYDDEWAMSRYSLEARWTKVSPDEK